MKISIYFLNSGGIDPMRSRFSLESTASQLRSSITYLAYKYMLHLEVETYGIGNQSFEFCP